MDWRTSGDRQTKISHRQFRIADVKRSAQSLVVLMVVAATYGGDSGQKLGKVNRFGHEIIRASVDGSDSIHDRRIFRYHDNRTAVVLFSQVFTQVRGMAVRKIYLSDDEPKLSVLCVLECFPARARKLYIVVPICLENEVEKPTPDDVGIHN